MNVSYTLYNVVIPSNNAANISTPFPAYNNIALTTLNSRMAEQAPYYPLPVLPISYFYDNQGTLRQYDSQGSGGGTMPFFTFSFLASGNNISSNSGTIQQYSLICDYDPVLVNNLSSFYLGNHNANLNMLVESTGQINLYPAVYIMELVFNQIYLMQVQQKI
jgi:hypothetical protein